MRNFNKLVRGDSGMSHTRSVARRIVPKIQLGDASKDDNSLRSIKHTVKNEEDRSILKWEEKNIGYNPPIITVGIIDHDMTEKIWMAMESLKDQTNIIFAWELIIIEEDGKSQDTVTSYIGKLPGCVRVLFKTVLPGSGKFIASVLKSQGMSEKYTCMEKFGDVMRLADKQSNIFVKQDAGTYSPHNRLYSHFVHFRDNQSLLSTQLNGYTYDVVENSFGLYIGNKIEPYMWDERASTLIGTIRPGYSNPAVKVRSTHLNIAYRLNAIRGIPLLQKPVLEQDLDDIIFIATFASTNKRPEEFPIVRYDAEIDDHGWQTGVSLVNCIASQKKQCVTPILDNAIDTIPEHIVDRLKSMHCKERSASLIKTVSKLRKKRDRAKTAMELREKEQLEILRHKQALADILEKRISEEKSLMKIHMEQQRKIEMQQLALDNVQAYREVQEKQLVDQNDTLQKQLQEEAMKIELETEKLNQRAFQLKKDRAKEEQLIEERRQETERLQKERENLEQSRARRVLEEDRMMKEADNLQLKSVSDIAEAEKAAREMKERIVILEQEQKKEKEAMDAREEEYVKLKAQETDFEIAQTKRAEQELLVIKEKEQLHRQLEKNSNRIQEDARRLNVKLQQIQKQKVIEKDSIAKKKAEIDRVNQEKAQLEELLKSRVKQEETLLRLEREKIKQQKQDLASARVRYNNHEKAIEEQAASIVEQAKENMKDSRSLYESATNDNVVGFRKQVLARTTFKRIDTYNSKILLASTDTAASDVNRYTRILEKELVCDITKLDNTPDPKLVGRYGTVIWQNVNYVLPIKTINQRYVYVIHDSSRGNWGDDNKRTMRRNDALIDTYIYTSDTIKEYFEENVLVPNNSYVIKGQDYTVNDKTIDSNTTDYQVLIAKYKDVLEMDHGLNSRMCIVTAVTGNYDSFITFYTNNLTCYVYSDIEMNFDNKKFVNIAIEDDCEQFNQMDGLRTNNKKHTKQTRNMMVAKYFKIKHHSIPELKRYDYTIWIDGRTVIHDIILLKFKIYDLFLKNDNLSIALHRHARFDTMYQDAICCKDYERDDYLQKRYNNQDIIGQYLKYYNNGFVCKKDYQECGFLIRNNRDPKTNGFFDAWWDENVNMTYQDQLSFRYLVQHLGINVEYIGNSVYDNPYSVISQHNAVINKQYNYNHETSGINKSFDLWDTLIGRICFSNTELFKLMERRLKIKHFAAYRVKCEEIVCKNTNNNFTIDDVYDLLHGRIGTTLSKQELLHYEFLTEISLTFDIHENMKMLDNDSIIVSDFFYDLERMSHFFRLKQLWIPNEKLFVSNGGKMSGDIWNTIPYNIKSHMGDNKWSDCDHPVYRERGIVTHHFNKNLNKYEDFMLKHNFDYIAYVVRSVRLSNPYTKNSDAWMLWDFYCTRYLPVMFLKLYSLKLLFDLENERIVFMSRDGYLMLHLFRAMFPSYEYDYIYISRNSMKSADEEYIRYVKDKVSGSIVIDLLGSGKSFTTFCKKHDIDYKSYVLFFMGRSHDNSIEYFPTTKMYAIFNYFNEYIERLNYAVHGSFAGFSDSKVVACDYDYDISYYIPIYRLMRLACNHASKVNDVLSEYDFDEHMLYKMLYFYFGEPSSFSQREILILDKIGHENEHDSRNNTNLTEIDKNYFLDLDEYIETWT